MTVTQNTPPDGQTDGAATDPPGQARGRPLAVVVPLGAEATRITVEDFATLAPPAQAR